MRDLIIVGGGVHSHEMAEIVERINADKKTWNFIGLAVSAKKLEQFKQNQVSEENGNLILGSYEIFDKYPNAYFVPDNGASKAPIPYERLATIIDPTCYVSRTAKIGKGCVFYPHCFIGLNAVVGDYVFSLSGATINHDDVIADRVIITSGVKLAGFVNVGADSYLGQSCTIRQKVSIGEKSLVGMGSVVINDVPAGSVVVGNPAKFLRENKK